MNTKLQKVLKIILYVLLVLGFIGLAISTYFNSSGVNEWWNTNVSPLLGGATIGAASSLIIQSVFSFANKNDMNLGIRSLEDLSSKVANTGESTQKIVNDMITTYNDNKESADKLAEEYKETRERVEQAIKVSSAVLDILEIMVRNDPSLVSNGTAKKIVNEIEQVKSEVATDEESESKGQ